MESWRRARRGPANSRNGLAACLVAALSVAVACSEEPTRTGIPDIGIAPGPDAGAVVDAGAASVDASIWTAVCPNGARGYTCPCYNDFQIEFPRQGEPVRCSDDVERTWRGIQVDVWVRFVATGHRQGVSRDYLHGSALVPEPDPWRREYWQPPTLQTGELIVWTTDVDTCERRIQIVVEECTDGGQ